MVSWHLPTSTEKICRNIRGSPMHYGETGDTMNDHLLHEHRKGWTASGGPTTCPCPHGDAVCSCLGGAGHGPGVDWPRWCSDTCLSHWIVIPGEGYRPHGGCSLNDLSEMCIRDFKDLVTSPQRGGSCPCEGSGSPAPAGTRAQMLRSRGSLARCLSLYLCVSSSGKWEWTVSSGCMTNTGRCGLKNRHLLSHILEAAIQDPGVSGLAPPEASPGHVDAIFSPCPHVVVPPRESMPWSPLPIRTTDLLDQGPTLVTSFHLIISVKMLCPHTVTFCGPGG